MNDWLSTQQPISGALVGRKGDFIHGDVCVDLKDTIGTTQFTVDVADIDATRSAALRQGQNLGVVLVQTADGRKFYVLDADDLHRIVYG